MIERHNYYTAVKQGYFHVKTDSINNVDLKKCEYIYICSITRTFHILLLFSSHWRKSKVSIFSHLLVWFSVICAVLLLA